MIGLITAEARGEVEKRRKRREREDRGGPTTAAAAAADGAREGHDLREDDCEPVMAGKSYQDRGIHLGPGQPLMPGQHSPQDYQRPYIQAGHGAPSPGYEPPNHPHVDLRGDRGSLRTLNPSAPVEGP